MTSVKGMTWGTPKFVTVAKDAEIQGESGHRLRTLLDEIEGSDLLDVVSYEVFADCRQQVKYMFELFDENDIAE
ncbi:hypothetical protein [Mesobacillus zeae]|uniref:hypothetical protein n=1 Tax=Mesobacillus zeae TaxID=1917180 RepID=UPI00300840CD